MKIAPRIVALFLPLLIAPIAFISYTAISASRSGITDVASSFLRFKTEELLRFADSQYQLLVANGLDDRPAFVEAAKESVSSYADGLIRADSELIFALQGEEGGLAFATGDLELSQSVRQRVLADSASAGEGWLEFRLSGADRVGYVSAFEPFGWRVFVTERRSSFFSAVDGITYQSIAVATGAVLIVVALLLVFSRALTRPLGHVVSAMRHIVDKGDLSSRVEVRYSDETGELAESFNMMTGALEQAYGDIKGYALEAAISRKREMKIRNVFQKYVPKEVIDQFFTAPESMLVGEDRDLAILFSDIRGFTAFSEGMPPHEVVESLNHYFERMVEEIMQNQGVVDKYIGDAIMAFYGAPAPNEQSADCAVKSAFGMLEELEHFNAWQAERGRPKIRIGVGINFGSVTIGNIGSERKMDYTVVGDMVNLASRLENLTKRYGLPIIVTDSVRRRITDGVFFRMVDRVQVAGRTRPTAIFSPHRGLTDREERAFRTHHTALKHYYNRDFETAIRFFRKAEEMLPDDGIVRMFLERASALAGAEPPPEWTGTVVLADK